MPHGHAMLGDEAEVGLPRPGRFERLFRTLPPFAADTPTNRG
jgi:hypothetical protein